MTERPGQQPTNGSPTRGRHHRNTSSRNRAITILALVVAIVAAAGLVTWLVRSNDSGDAAADTAATAPLGTGTVATTASGSRSGTSGGPAGAGSATGSPSSTADGDCSSPGGSVIVAAAPDIAEVVTELTGQASVDGCPIDVQPTEPADFAAGNRTAAIWIPDSSMWIATAESNGMAAPATGPSIATSPLVLALPTATAARLAADGSADVADILASRKTAEPVRVGLPDPTRSAAAVGAILATRAAVTGTSDARAALTWAVRSSSTGMAAADSENLDRLATDPNTAVPVSEQAVIAHNTDGGAPAVAVYPGSGGAVLDYPVVATSNDKQSAAAVDDLVRLLTGTQGRAALLAAGFRAPDGTPDPAATTSDLGVDPDYRSTAPLPDAATINDAIRSVQVTNEPSRMLAVIDISGSMQGVVPGANGATRIALAKEAATRGLALYGPDSDIGLWVFSRTLTSNSDHQELIPISTLGPDQQGGTGAQRLSQALAGLQSVPEGGTGLYDTVLDAVRTMRAGYDPSRINAVLVLTDGMNDDQGSISLDGLLSTLASEQDPSRPVPVISIAFGPDSDVDALGQISRVTGGATYESKDPRQIGEIFLDAVGQRLCRPSC
jgi:hypothetical protein